MLWDPNVTLQSEAIPKTQDSVSLCLKQVLMTPKQKSKEDSGYNISLSHIDPYESQSIPIKMNLGH